MQIHTWFAVLVRGKLEIFGEPCPVGKKFLEYVVLCFVKNVWICFFGRQVAMPRTNCFVLQFHRNINLKKKNLQSHPPMLSTQMRMGRRYGRETPEMQSPATTVATPNPNSSPELTEPYFSAILRWSVHDEPPEDRENKLIHGGRGWFVLLEVF